MTDALVDRIVREVAELPDRTSPDDWPEAMLVTADELRAIVGAALAAAQAEAPDIKTILAEADVNYDEAPITHPYSATPDAGIGLLMALIVIALTVAILVWLFPTGGL